MQGSLVVHVMVYVMVYAVVGRGRLVHSRDVARGGASLLDSLKSPHTSAYPCGRIRAFTCYVHTSVWIQLLHLLLRMYMQTYAETCYIVCTGRVRNVCAKRVDMYNVCAKRVDMYVHMAANKCVDMYIHMAVKSVQCAC